jgi:hypothetical protein
MLLLAENWGFVRVGIYTAIGVAILAGFLTPKPPKRQTAAAPCGFATEPDN